MAVSQRERQTARLMARDSLRAQRRGVVAALRVSLRVEAAAKSALRARKSPVQAVADALDKSALFLRDAMILSHLEGMARAQLLGRKSIVFATSVFKEAHNVLIKRLKLSAKVINELVELYDAEALRVVKDVNITLERKLQTAVIDIQQEGLHVREGVKRIEEAFDKAGLTASNNGTFETIYRTQTQLAYGAGHWEADQDPVIQDILWGYKYVTVGDARVRDTHAALDGVTLPKEDDQWGSIFPPNGWNCRCQAIPIFDVREIIEPESLVEVDGETIIPGADEGFQFNPGTVFVRKGSNIGAPSAL